MATALKQVTTYLDPAAYKWAVTKAKSEGRTLSQLLARLVITEANAKPKAADPVRRIEPPASPVAPVKVPVPEPEPEEESDDERFAREQREFDPDEAYACYLKRGSSPDEAYAHVKAWLSALDLPEEGWEPLIDMDGHDKIMG